MYQRPKKTLSIGQICRSWYPELERSSTALDVLTLLLQAYWRGDFSELHRPEETEKFSRRHGLEALVGIGKTEGHPEIVLCQEREQLTAAQVSQPNGNLLVDLRTYVFLPERAADWTEEVLDQAYEKPSGMRGYKLCAWVSRRIPNDAPRKMQFPQLLAIV